MNHQPIEPANETEPVIPSGDDADHARLGQPPSARKGSTSRNRLIMAIVIPVTLVLGIVVGIKVSQHSDEALIKPRQDVSSGNDRPVDVEASSEGNQIGTTTAEAVTTTTSEEDAIASTLTIELSDIGHELDYDRREALVNVAFIIRNLTDKKIEAFQFGLILSSVDKLGRTGTLAQTIDCMRAPLAPHEERQFSITKEPQQDINDDSMSAFERYLKELREWQNAVRSAEDNCTYESIELNIYSDEHSQLYSALNDGLEYDCEIVVSRVVFEDGTALGKDA